jgi:hypothetical protein
VIWGHIPGAGTVTIHPSRGADTKLRVRGYFTKKLKKRAPRYQLKFGDWTSRTASP